MGSISIKVKKVDKPKLTKQQKIHARVEELKTDILKVIEESGKSYATYDELNKKMEALYADMDLTDPNAWQDFNSLNAAATSLLKSAEEKEKLHASLVKKLTKIIKRNKIEDKAAAEIIDSYNRQFN